jgi:hypothetical protein
MKSNCIVSFLHFTRNKHPSSFCFGSNIQWNESLSAQFPVTDWEVDDQHAGDQPHGGRHPYLTEKI